jgi:hypothetical protein
MFGFKKTTIEPDLAQKKLNDSIMAEIKSLDLQVSKAFSEIATLTAKYEALTDLYSRMKGRTNRLNKEEETENINSPAVLKTN